MRLCLRYRSLWSVMAYDICPPVSHPSVLPMPCAGESAWDTTMATMSPQHPIVVLFVVQGLGYDVPTAERYAILPTRAQWNTCAAINCRDRSRLNTRSKQMQL
jgi:hypothetical protein